MEPEALKDEIAILKRVAEGDESAFRLLFDHYRNRLYFYALRLSSSPQHAEDVLQDSFLRIWLKREQLGSINNFSSYLFRVAHNGVLSGLQRKATEAAILSGKLAPTIGEVEPEEQLHFKLVREVLQESVNQLPDQQRKVFQLRREQGLRIKEIAEILNISEITVKRHLTQAQKNLREALLMAFPEDGSIFLIILGLAIHNF